MTKVVFFDFYNTLAYFEPSREKFYSEVAHEFGIKVTPEAIGEALPDADLYWRSENLKSPIKDREQNDKYATYTQYAMRILKDASPSVTPEQALQILGKAFAIGFKFVAYNDSLPTLKAVKGRNLKTGVISNIGQEIDTYCKELGFEPYLDFKVTSFEVGFDKPHPEIFEFALNRAGVPATDAIFVGDQYEQDVVGARGVGITPVLINRNAGLITSDCKVINSLTSILDLV